MLRLPARSPGSPYVRVRHGRKDCQQGACRQLTIFRRRIVTATTCMVPTSQPGRSLSKPVNSHSHHACDRKYGSDVLYNKVPWARSSNVEKTARYSGRCRSFDVHDRWAVPSANDDDVAFLTAGVALSMDRAPWHIQEVARASLDHIGTARSRFHQEGAVDHVDGCVVVSVVVPARDHVCLSPDQPGPQPVHGNSLFPGHTRSALTFDSTRRPHQPYWVRSAHGPSSTSRRELRRHCNSHTAQRGAGHQLAIKGRLAGSGKAAGCARS